MFRIYFIPALITLNLLIGFAPWGGVSLALIIVLTYLAFPPDRVFHPNNMLFAYYGLYVVVSCGLNFILSMIGWEYQLPWGQTVFWDTFATYTLYQIEVTYLVLYFALYFFCGGAKSSAVGQPSVKLEIAEVSPPIVYATIGISIFLVVWFIQATAGIGQWLSDYSETYLSKREGYGLLNVAIAPVGTAAVFLLGVMTYHAQRKGRLVLLFLALLIILSFQAGFKSRLIVLIMIYLAPYLMKLRFSLKWVGRLAVIFFVLLYLGTLIRTGGFYASPAFFMEMLIGYFNTYQLHDWIVGTRNPDWFTTSYQVLIKPLQIFGYAGVDDDFDISVMLTKEFFPEQWYREHATQQWPLETELYLNYYGILLEPLPLIIYASVIGWLFRRAIIRMNLPMIPVFLLEFLRMFSMLRGTLIPWELPIYILQYLLVYAICRLALTGGGVRAISQYQHA
ncbi:hypothetical protein HZY97_00535 [Sphingomonas sp. R-74633]|uniref:hypothetical protein n=1 Tax=Sphingomonas sp. R-74633 TaxID=2751188 RepID=UPI0015D1DB63|nr:hypothetical protein [Sphingomonas sp. R-74633]NYT39230.1 hypothetical protein [Sphingomonas sp. R-74633]